MDRLVITIHPTPSDEGLLRVSDAMEQVIDALRVFEQAERVLVPPQEYFEWRLERASAGSPFMVVAVAELLDATINVTPYIVCTENLIRIDCVIESPNVSGDDRPSPLCPSKRTCASDLPV
jgi:hypothetical protein